VNVVALSAGDKDADAKAFLERPLPVATSVEAASEHMRRSGLRLVAGLPPPPNAAGMASTDAARASTDEGLGSADRMHSLRSHPVDTSSATPGGGEGEELGEGELLGAVGVSREGRVVRYLLEDLPRDALKKVCTDCGTSIAT
jgi:hypothetical protein